VSGLREDLVVVGGGPAGLISAAAAARRGLSVTVLEEDEIVGRPEHCAGLYSVRGLSMIGVELRRSYVQNLVWGAEIHSPSGRVLEVSSPAPVAVVASREDLDRYLAERAIRAGARVLLGARALSAKLEGDEVHIHARSHRFSSKAMIIAEGARGMVARGVFGGYTSRNWMPITQLLVRGHRLDKRRVHVWLKSYTRGFFGYLVPIDEELGRLGVASSSEPLSKAVRLISEEIPRAKIIGYSSHVIYRGPPLEYGLEGRILLVGDSAGQVKATTGGGVVVGGICAQAAAEHVWRLLVEGRPDTYRRLTRKLYRELKWIYRFSEWLTSLPEERIEALLRAAAESGLADTLSLRGDMDFQIGGLLRSMASVGGLKFLAYITKTIVG